MFSNFSIRVCVCIYNLWSIMRYVRYNIIHIIELTQQPSNIEILIAILVHCADVLHLHRIILYHVYMDYYAVSSSHCHTHTQTHWKHHIYMRRWERVTLNESERVRKVDINEFVLSSGDVAFHFKLLVAYLTRYKISPLLTPVVMITRLSY